MSAANGTGAGPLPNPGSALRGGLAPTAAGELRSAELVSRLLAATPPYLYNMPLVPHSYFFSEMLRSFVHAKNNNDSSKTNNQMVPQPGHRRSRKRSWNQSKISPPIDGSPAKQEWSQRPAEIWNNRSTVNSDERQQHQYEEKYQDASQENSKNHHLYEKPLELTINKSIIPKHMPNFKFTEKPDEEKRESPEIDVQVKSRKSPKLIDGSASTKEEKYQANLLGQPGPPAPVLALPPPPPPLWYPPLYPPPYGIDPLNFFIDLRVSGHIYDRKHGTKEAQNLTLSSNSLPVHQETPNADTNLNNKSGLFNFENNNISAFKDSVKSNRHVSAFSVPKPRDPNKKLFPMNLCHNGSSKFNMKYYDDVDVKVHERNVVKNTTSTHYVMQNLKRIYGDLTNNTICEDIREESEKQEQEMDDNLDGANDSEPSEVKNKRRKDTKTLIGLELVVDYVKTGKKVSANEEDEVTSEDGRDSSSDVEVLGDQSVD